MLKKIKSSFTSIPNMCTQPGNYVYCLWVPWRIWQCWIQILSTTEEALMEGATCIGGRSRSPKRYTAFTSVRVIFLLVFLILFIFNKCGKIEITMVFLLCFILYYMLLTEEGKVAVIPQMGRQRDLAVFPIGGIYQRHIWLCGGITYLRWASTSPVGGGTPEALWRWKNCHSSTQWFSQLLRDFAHNILGYLCT